MVQVAHTGALFDNVTDDLAARHNRCVDFLLVSVIRAHSSDEKPGANISFSNERLMRSCARYADIAATNRVCQVMRRSDWQVQLGAELACKYR